MTVEIMPQHIDINGHVNNVQYVQWMQDVAIAHSQTVGGSQALHEFEATWFAREHHIKYLLQVKKGEELLIRTWADSFKRTSSIRKYDFYRRSDTDNSLVAEASTVWVYVDLKTGRPRPIPETLRKLYIEDDHGGRSD
jgi:acyl-CoA thioester hydrolase